MQLIGYSAPQVDVSAVLGLGGLLSWTEATVRQTARRAVALASLLDRVGSTLDDVAELRRAAEIIAANLRSATPLPVVLTVGENVDVIHDLIVKIFPHKGSIYIGILLLCPNSSLK